MFKKVQNLHNNIGKKRKQSYNLEPSWTGHKLKVKCVLTLSWVDLSLVVKTLDKKLWKCQERLWRTWHLAGECKSPDDNLFIPCEFFGVVFTPAWNLTLTRVGRNLQSKSCRHLCSHTQPCHTVSGEFSACLNYFWACFFFPFFHSPRIQREQIRSQVGREQDEHRQQRERERENVRLEDSAIAEFHKKKYLSGKRSQSKKGTQRKVLLKEG